MRQPARPLHIASLIRSNVPNLEGALLRVSTFAALTGMAITFDFGREVLGDQAAGVGDLDREVVGDRLLDRLNRHAGAG